MVEQEVQPLFCIIDVTLEVCRGSGLDPLHVCIQYFLNRLCAAWDVRAIADSLIASALECEQDGRLHLRCFDGVVRR